MSPAKPLQTSLLLFMQQGVVLSLHLLIFVACQMSLIKEHMFQDKGIVTWKWALQELEALMYLQKSWDCTKTILEWVS